jgi:type IV pilus assembly protein PilM
MPVLTRLRRLFNGGAPTASVEIAADRVTGLTLGRGVGREVVAVVTEALPAGVLTPTANATNIADQSAVSEAVRRVLTQLPGTPSRVALVVPDSAAKVSLMTFEQIPARVSDLDQLVRWQSRKTVPFRVEDAQVAYSSGLPTEDGGCELIVSLMRRDIVEEYETVCLSAGGHAGVVDLASFSVVNAVLAGGGADQEDWLLVHVAHGYSTIVIVRRGRIILFRNRPAEGDDDLGDLVHQTKMYYEDRLEGGGFWRVILAVSAADTEGKDSATLRRLIESRLGGAVERIDLGVSGTHLPGPGDLMAAPIGLLLRERMAAEIGA